MPFLPKNECKIYRRRCLEKIERINQLMSKYITNNSINFKCLNSGKDELKLLISVVNLITSNFILEIGFNKNFDEDIARLLLKAISINNTITGINLAKLGINSAIRLKFLEVFKMKRNIKFCIIDNKNIPFQYAEEKAKFCSVVLKGDYKNSKFLDNLIITSLKESELIYDYLVIDFISEITFRVTVPVKFQSFSETIYIFVKF